MKRACLLFLLCAAGCAAPLQTLPPPAAGAGPQDAAALEAQSRAASKKVPTAPTADARAALAHEAIEAAQRCQQAAPTSAACDYALALALGVQARERPSTAIQALPLMVQLLRQANSRDARLDKAGPARVLALVLVRAPGWPLGPGDPDAGLKAAQQAVALFPDYAPNQLALSEALLTAGDDGGARAAATRGLELARAALASGEEDAPQWERDAQALLDGRAPR